MHSHWRVQKRSLSSLMSIYGIVLASQFLLVSFSQLTLSKPRLCILSSAHLVVSICHHKRSCGIEEEKAFFSSSSFFFKKRCWHCRCVWFGTTLPISRLVSTLLCTVTPTVPVEVDISCNCYKLVIGLHELLAWAQLKLHVSWVLFCFKYYLDSCLCLLHCLTSRSKPRTGNVDLMHNT